MTTDTVGGVWTYALELTEALAAHDVETTLVALGNPLSPDQRRALRRSPVRQAYAWPCALEWMDDPWRDVARTGRQLLALAEELEPDVIHLNQYAYGALPWSRPVLVVGHSDVLSWHRAVRGREAAAEWSRYRDAVEEGLTGADLLVAPTRAQLDALVRDFDPPCPRRVIPNGTARAFPRRDKAHVVLTAGRVWDEAKNAQALVRVAPRLPWPVHVAGEGPVARGVRSLGRLGRGEMDEELARAAIFAEPARYEPFGLAALEAARAGCALVLGDIPSLREVWGDAAVFVPADDHDALAGALLSLIEDERRRDAYAARAARAARAYSSERMGAAYAAAYARLTAPKAVALR